MKAAEVMTGAGTGAPSMSMRWRVGLAGIGVTILSALAIVTMAGGADAQEQSDQSFDNQYCLGCHANEGMQTTMPSGEILPLTFDVDAHEASVHGPLDIPCVLCHTDVTEFPHEPIVAPDLRAWTLERNQACAGCHDDEAAAGMDTVHAAALAAG